MAGSKVKLTQTVVEKAKPGDKRYLLTDTEIAGFRLIVSPSGRKSYACGTVSEADAVAQSASPRSASTPRRSRSCPPGRRDWAAIVRTGGDPSEARQKQREAPTLSDLLDRYLVEYAPTEKRRAARRKTGA